MARRSHGNKAIDQIRCFLREKVTTKWGNIIASLLGVPETGDLAWHMFKSKTPLIPSREELKKEIPFFMDTAEGRAQKAVFVPMWARLRRADATKNGQPMTSGDPGANFSEKQGKGANRCRLRS